MIIDIEKLSAPIDISIPLRFNGAQPNAFGVSAATSVALGETRRGSSVNFDQVTFVPHCNGTHTECVAHITHERLSVRDCLRDVLMRALLVSIKPENIGGDQVITRNSLVAAVFTIGHSRIDSPLSDDGVLGDTPTALIVRTLPNDLHKLTRRYDEHNIPPYFALDAMDWVAEYRFKHLLVDLPSIDRLDDPTLPAHRTFWNVEMGSHHIEAATDVYSTITELIYVPNEVVDGIFTLNLQIAPFEADCAPSRPLLLGSIQTG